MLKRFRVALCIVVIHGFFGTWPKADAQVGTPVQHGSMFNSEGPGPGTGPVEAGLSRVVALNCPAKTRPARAGAAALDWLADVVLNGARGRPRSTRRRSCKWLRLTASCP